MCEPLSYFVHPRQAAWCVHRAARACAYRLPSNRSPISIAAGVLANRGFLNHPECACSRSFSTSAWDYRHMDGFSVHTFRIHKDGSKIKFHLARNKCREPDDERGNHCQAPMRAAPALQTCSTPSRLAVPSWTLKVWIMDPADGY
jgi:hypothetical protein